MGGGWEWRKSGIFNISSTWQHVVGPVARLLMVWDEPMALYITSVLGIGDDVGVIGAVPSPVSFLYFYMQELTGWNLMAVRGAVAQGRGANPLARRLGLRTEQAVSTFIRNGMPGLDLVLLSSRYKAGAARTRGCVGSPQPGSACRWAESLAALLHELDWQLVDVVDLERSAVIQEIAGKIVTGWRRGGAYPSADCCSPWHLAEQAGCGCAAPD